MSLELSSVRIAIVTARNSPSDLRVIKTLRHWGVYVDEARRDQTAADVEPPALNRADLGDNAVFYQDVCRPSRAGCRRVLYQESVIPISRH